MTTVPIGNFASQGPVSDWLQLSFSHGFPEVLFRWQLIPAGLLVATPLPQPSIQTDSVLVPLVVVVVVVGGTVVVVSGAVVVVVEVEVVVVVLAVVVVVGRGFASAAEGRNAIKATAQANVAT